MPKGERREEIRPDPPWSLALRKIVRHQIGKILKKEKKGIITDKLL